MIFARTHLLWSCSTSRRRIGRTPSIRHRHWRPFWSSYPSVAGSSSRHVIPLNKNNTISGVTRLSSLRKASVEERDVVRRVAIESERNAWPGNHGNVKQRLSDHQDRRVVLIVPEIAPSELPPSNL